MLNKYFEPVLTPKWCTCYCMLLKLMIYFIIHFIMHPVFPVYVLESCIYIIILSALYSALVQC